MSFGTFLRGENLNKIVDHVLRASFRMAYAF
jgi:hypothetical protein